MALPQVSVGGKSSMQFVPGQAGNKICSQSYQVGRRADRLIMLTCPAASSGSGNSSSGSSSQQSSKLTPPSDVKKDLKSYVELQQEDQAAGQQLLSNMTSSFGKLENVSKYSKALSRAEDIEVRIQQIESEQRRLNRLDDQEIKRQELEIEMQLEQIRRLRQAGLRNSDAGTDNLQSAADQFDKKYKK